MLLVILDPEIGFEDFGRGSKPEQSGIEVVIGVKFVDGEEQTDGIIVRLLEVT
jgi:hypothetical protein